MKQAPRAGDDYPRTLSEFLDWFPDERACTRYLVNLRWPDGDFSCACGGQKFWRSKRGLYICAICGRQTSVRAGTIFEHSSLPLLTWFRAAWLMATQKDGISALNLQRQLGLPSYESAWTILHKLRRAMVKTSEDLLEGEIEVDETYVGGVLHDKRETKDGKPAEKGRGRGATENKEIVVIAVERGGKKLSRRRFSSEASRKGRERARVQRAGKPRRWRPKPLGRVRMRRLDGVSGDDLIPFIEAVCKPGSTIYTDAWKGYSAVADAGFTHVAINVSDSGDPAHVHLPAVHRVAALLKRWILSTHQGGIRRQHLESYLDEFCFRFNRRRSTHPGLVFYRLLEQAVVTRPASYETIVWSRRGLAAK